MKTDSLNAPGGIKAQRYCFKPIHRPRRGVDVTNHFVVRIKSNAEQHLRQPASLASLLTGKEGYSAPVVNAAYGDYLHDTSLLSLQSAVQKLGFPASQIASQKLGAEGQSLTLPGDSPAKANSSKTIENKGGNSLSDAAWRVLTNIQKWCLSMTPLELFFKDRPSLQWLEVMGIEPL